MKSQFLMKHSRRWASVCGEISPTSNVGQPSKCWYVVQLFGWRGELAKRVQFCLLFLLRENDTSL